MTLHVLMWTCRLVLRLLLALVQPPPTYAQLLQDPRWKAKRTKILKRDGHRCRTCRSRYALQVHHKAYYRLPGFRPPPWLYPDYWLVTLCRRCHAREHGA